MNHQYSEPITQAAKALHQGDIIAYPTEAVYGLGCDPQNEQAVYRLLALKQRCMSKGLILIAASLTQLLPYLAPIPEQAMHKALATWPGPTTWLFPASQQTPDWIRGGHTSVAVRVSAHPIASQLCMAFGAPLVSSSANKSEQIPARNAAEVLAMFPQGIAKIVSGQLGGLCRPTCIRDVLTGRIIRE